ncbi:MAG: tRNA preQ1(34) S-adenosylmethionine ribosyltransferase-isomerase QueA [Pseudomonadota bacterium]
MGPEDFDYTLPDTLIARHPTERRTDSRLLTMGGDGVPVDHRFIDLPSMLRRGDLLVFNDTKVIAARLHGRKSTGGIVEVLLDRVLNERTAVAQIRASHAPKTNADISIDGHDGQVAATARVLSRDGRFFNVEFDRDIDAVLAAGGHVPLPPYIDRADQPGDQERYQTVYASKPGAVAAPTAGLHFDSAILATLEQAGIGLDFVTLHVAAGTFQPLSDAELSSGLLHSEQLVVDAALCERITRTKSQGGRVICVGTTSLRALESAAANGELSPMHGETRLFIRPGYEFRVADGLLTNFHLPRSSLMMLVAAFAGYEPIMAAYQHAVREHYRFFSYGDAMLLMRDHEDGSSS